MSVSGDSKTEIRPSDKTARAVLLSLPLGDPLQAAIRAGESAFQVSLAGRPAISGRFIDG